MIKLTAEAPNAISKTTIYVEQPGKVEVIKDVIRNIEARDSQKRRFSSAGSNVPPQSRYDWIRDVVAGRSYFVNPGDFRLLPGEPGRPAFQN